MGVIMDRIKQAPGAMVHFVSDRLARPEVTDATALENDSGALIAMDGKKIAVYKDPEGNVHALSPVCQHWACIVDWNSEAKTWDCPCHGSRYDAYGKVMNGPAKKDLTKVDLSKVMSDSGKS